MEFLVAKCPNCSGDLRLPDDKKQVKCLYCGFDILVQEAVKAAGVSVENLLKLATTAEKSGNYQEAYDYFTKILEYEPNNYSALFGKAVSAGRLSTGANPRLEELSIGIESAIESAPNSKKAEIKKQAAETISEICVSHEGLPKENSLIDCLETAHKYHPENVNAIKSIIVRSSSIISRNQRSIANTEGEIDWNKERIAQLESHSSKHPDRSSDIKKEKAELERNSAFLNGRKKELEHYIGLKNRYFEKLQSIDSEAASSLVESLQKFEESNNDHIRRLQEIRTKGKQDRALQSSGGGCLIGVVTCLLFIILILTIVLL